MSKAKKNLQQLRKDRLLQKYGDLNDKELMMELLYAQSIQIDKLERTRSNTNVMVWWLIVIPIICTAILMMGLS